jgi:hypothetical protein
MDNLRPTGDLRLDDDLSDIKRAPVFDLLFDLYYSALFNSFERSLGKFGSE